MASETLDYARPAATLKSAAPSRGRSVGVAMLIAASVLWSLSGIAVKVAQMDSVAFAFWRSAAGAVVLGLAIPLAKGGWPRLKWMATSVAVYTVVVTLLITSMTLGTAAEGILLQYTGPVWCALFAWLFQGRKIGAYTLAALVVATVGIGVMVSGVFTGREVLGPVAGLLSGVAFGALVLILEKLDRVGSADGRPVNPLALVFLNNAGAALILLPICLAAGTIDVSGAQFAIVATTGAIQLAIPYAMFQMALRRVEPVDASLLILLEPVLNPIWVAMTTGETPEARTVIGGCAILAAMVIDALKPASGAR